MAAYKDSFVVRTSCALFGRWWQIRAKIGKKKKHVWSQSAYGTDKVWNCPKGLPLFFHWLTKNCRPLNQLPYWYFSSPDFNFAIWHGIASKGKNFQSWPTPGNWVHVDFESAQEIGTGNEHCRFHCTAIAIFRNSEHDKAYVSYFAATYNAELTKKTWSCERYWIFYHSISQWLFSGKLISWNISPAKMTDQYWELQQKWL